MVFQQPWRGTGDPETEAAYASTIITDSPAWKKISWCIYTVFKAYQDLN